MILHYINKSFLMDSRLSSLDALLLVTRSVWVWLTNPCTNYYANTYVALSNSKLWPMHHSRALVCNVQQWLYLFKYEGQILKLYPYAVGFNWIRIYDQVWINFDLVYVRLWILMCTDTVKYTMLHDFEILNELQAFFL